MHFICDIPKKEGTYHVRIYDIPLAQSSSQMEVHIANHSPNFPLIVGGIDLGTPVSGDLVYEEGFGDMQSSIENEIDQGAMERQNFKISLEADPVFSVLVASMRNLKMDIWCEITLEQLAENIPALVPLVHVQPRKERSLFWGKLVRNEAAGYSDYQKYTGGLVRDPKVRMHVGGLEMTFVHWLPARLAMLTESDLLAYRNAITIPPDPHVGRSFFLTPLAPLLMFLVEKASPTVLVSAVDHHYSEKPYYFSKEAREVSAADCNIELTYFLDGDSSTPVFFLGELYIPLWRYGAGIDPDGYTFIWFHDDSGAGDHGQYSFFTRWKTFGDALISFCREFFLRMDVEIPTMRELAGNFEGGNTQEHRIAHWAGTTRWAFVNIEASNIEIVARPQKESVKYNPCAIWISHLKISEPNPGQIDNTKWFNADVEWTNPIAEGLDITYETLFRFVGGAFVGGGTIAQYDGGNELYIEKSWGRGAPSFEPARHVAYFDTFNTPWDTWCGFQLNNRLTLWGGARAIVEFDHEGIGITKFGGTVAHFGFLDYGDYANLRGFNASPGLLFEGSDFGSFSVISINRKPGGDTHIKAIEKNTITLIWDGVIAGGPGDPPVRRIDPPPPFSGSPVCGTVTITFCVLAPSDCVDHADITVNGQFFGTVNNFPDPMPEDCVPVTVVINTANLPNGLAVVCITVTFCNGDTLTQCWNFNVQNPCSIANTTQKAF